jgi:hypothetical protein
MDPKLIPTQLELLRVTMRRESTRLEPVQMAAIRSRAFAILDKVEGDADGDQALLRDIAAVRDEL